MEFNHFHCSQSSMASDYGLFCCEATSLRHQRGLWAGLETFEHPTPIPWSGFSGPRTASESGQRCVSPRTTSPAMVCCFRATMRALKRIPFPHKTTPLTNLREKAVCDSMCILRLFYRVLSWQIRAWTNISRSRPRWPFRTAIRWCCDASKCWKLW